MPSHLPISTTRRTGEISPSGIGGALAFGALSGLTLGPVGAVAGILVGVAAGELLDRRVEGQRVRTYADAASHHSTRKSASR